MKPKNEHQIFPEIRPNFLGRIAYLCVTAQLTHSRRTAAAQLTHRSPHRLPLQERLQAP